MKVSVTSARSARSGLAKLRVLTTTFALLLWAALALPAAASAAPLGAFEQFGIEANGGNVGANPHGTVAGPDGNLWFTDQGTTPAIGKITPAGTITEYSTGLNAGANPQQIAAGPDGNLWFTDFGATPAIGKITPAGTITEYGIAAEGGNPGALPHGIVAGPDGNLWFTDNGTTPAIGKINPTTHAITEYGIAAEGGNPEPSPEGTIALGPDGNLWFTDAATGAITPVPAIGRINPTTHAVNEYPTAGEPVSIAAGPDGNLWFTELLGKVDKINPTTHAITPFSKGLQTLGFGSLLVSITPGPDGNLWFTDNGGIGGAEEMIGHIKPTGAIAESALPAGSSVPFFGTGPGTIAPGPDGNLWFADEGTTKAIDRIGAAAPAASLRLPAVNGTAQVGTQQTCGGDRWANWAGMQPEDGGLLASSTTPPAVQWRLDGTPIAGPTGTARTYTPLLSDKDHMLSCTTTVTYRNPLNVTVGATSAGTKVIPQNSGPPGPTGATGSAGTNGATGPAGAQGPAGAPGRDAKVTCTVKKKGTKVKVTCKVLLVASASSARLRWSLLRGGHAYAHGSTRARRGHARVRLNLSRLARGRYLLHLEGQRKGTVIVVS